MDFVASPTSIDKPEASTRAGDGMSDAIHARESRLTRSQDARELDRPAVLKHVSSPAYTSPLRHHQRHPSAPHRVKESLNARSEYVTSQDDGTAEHRINQYVIKQEIGRGSFGAVHVAVDQYGTEFAVKEFSKSRLRKRAQSHILRRPRSQRKRGALQGFNSPLHRGGADRADQGNALDLIKEEIAIMKKLNHPNLARLIEVLDDPSEDSLYMVMEMCKKGVVMRISLEPGSRADPYPTEMCRCWFRDLILGIEYLHAQGIVHRDIKPDNCLITDDDVLKVVDFGVSEMFEKTDSEMRTAKSAGSPAFMPPELCVVKHGDVSGRAADIWSMGVTLYCLKYGQIPFQSDKILDMYDSIKNDAADMKQEGDADFRDLMDRILQKDPAKRIKMPELRNHPWVTCGGTDPLLSEAENTSDLIDPPTDAEVEAAITGNMRNLMNVVKAVNKFRSLTAQSRDPVMTSILGETAEHQFSQPPGRLGSPEIRPPGAERRSISVNLDDRRAVEASLVAEGVHRELLIDNDWDQQHGGSTLTRDYRGDPHYDTGESDQDNDAALDRLRNSFDRVVLPNELPPFRSSIYNARTTDDIGRRGHAHDPLEDRLFLRIGPSTFAGRSEQADDSHEFLPDDAFVVSESPGAADVDIYETAYRDEIERILAKAQAADKEPQVYLTRRVDEKLPQLSGLAGKLVAHGEEAKSQFMDYTDFMARRARVTEVSRALREAARAEYEKRRQERKAWIEEAKTEKARAPTWQVPSPSPPPSAMPQRPPMQASEYSRSWRSKAVDRGRDAKSSVKGLVSMVKDRAKKDNTT